LKSTKNHRRTDNHPKSSGLNKLAKLLAASVGAGLVAGAGFRLGEAMTAGRATSKPEPAGVAAEEPGLAHRVSLLEKEVAGHSAGLSELRECSLRTERTLQKLLLGIDRLIAPSNRPEPDGTSQQADAR
jgi:hypothetical protein